MKLEVRNRCSDFDSYRAARVKSLFNAETGANFSADFELDLEQPWQLGVIVGPSGTGKTSAGKLILPGAYYEPTGWPADAPIVDAIAPDGDFNAVTGALAAVGLGTVPAWLRPYHALSNGERFRADLARIIAEAPEHVVVDEFTSVVDRQIARMGALAFAKAWRRTSGKCVLLTCHYDVLEWLQPDWILDTATGRFSREGLQRPRFELEVWQTDGRYWPMFEPHHYLRLPRMVAAKYYVGAVDGELVAHLAVSTKNKGKGVEARACRLVVMPEWQGAGVGMRFLNAICEANLEGAEWGRLPGRRLTTLFHTSHPGLVAALRRDRRWIQLSARLFASGSRAKANRTIRRAAQRSAKAAELGWGLNAGTSGYGGHFRAVQGFRYVGAPA